MKDDADPLRPTQRLQDSPRCAARSKQTGLPCKGPAVQGYRVCRLHGARGGHGPGKAHPSYRHGGRTREAETVRKAVNVLRRDGRAALQALLDD